MAPHTPRRYGAPSAGGRGFRHYVSSRCSFSILMCPGLYRAIVFNQAILLERIDSGRCACRPPLAVESRIVKLEIPPRNFRTRQMLYDIFSQVVHDKLVAITIMVQVIPRDGSQAVFANLHYRTHHVRIQIRTAVSDCERAGQIVIKLEHWRRPNTRTNAIEDECASRRKNGKLALN